MSNAPEKIIYVRTSDILSHPNQLGIYGDEPIDNELLASIKERGILNPLIITKSEVYHKVFPSPYICVSGHRRLSHTKLANIEVVPAIIRDYKDEMSCDLDHILLNSQREKTNAQRIAEFLQHKQILSQLGKLHQSKGLYNDTLFEDEQFCTNVQNLKIDPEKPLNSVEILSGLTGFSKREQQKITIVRDMDYRGKKVKKYQDAKIDNAELIKLYEDWEDITNRVVNKELTLTEAAKKVKSLLAPFEKYCRGLKPKPERHVGKKLRKGRTAKPPKIDLDKLFREPGKRPAGHKMLTTAGYDKLKARISVDNGAGILDIYVQIPGDEYVVDLTELIKLAINHKRAANV